MDRELGDSAGKAWETREQANANAIKKVEKS